VGCGAVIEMLYKKPLMKLEKKRELTVVGLVDSNQSRAKRLQAFFPNASIYTNLKSSLLETNTNLTIVTSPPFLHAEHSIIALRNGNHVLCEKPMAITREQCDQMIHTAKNSRRLLAIAMPRRFYPALIYLKNLIIDGVLGEHLSFSYWEGENYNWPVTTSFNFQRDKGGGGVLFDIGSHVLDIIIWLFGIPINISYFDDAMVSGVETNCIFQMNSQTFNGHIQLSWDNNLANKFCITGTEAEAIFMLESINKLYIKNSNGFQKIIPQIAFALTTNTEKIKRKIPKTIFDCIYLEIVQVIRAIKLNENFPVTGDSGKEVISLIEKCYEIAKPLNMNWLPTMQSETYKQLHWNGGQ